MTFSDVGYMTWAKLAGLECELFLSNSGTSAPPADWLPPADLTQALTYAEAYGDPALTAAIAHQYGAVPEQVLLANGTSEANFLLLAALAGKTRAVACEQPTYEPLRRVCETLFPEVHWLRRTPESGYAQVDLLQLQTLLEQGVGGVVLSNLHNPTGAVFEPDHLRAISDAVAAAGAWMLVDEVYLDFLFQERYPSAFTLGPHAYSTSSLTKVYGLGTLRCGWAIGDLSTIERAYRIRDNLGVVASGPSVVLARGAFEVLERLAAWSAWKAAAGRAVVEKFMRGCTELEWLAPKYGIMGVARLPEGLSGYTLSERAMREAKVKVTPGEFFWMPGYVRIAFGSEPARVEEALRRLIRVVESRSG